MLPPYRRHDVRALLDTCPAEDTSARAAAEAREPTLTKPPGSLGRLEQAAAWLAAWQGRHPPRLDRVRCVIFAGNHGVAARGVSAFPAEVTAQMVANFQAGGAAINQLCKAGGADLDVYPLDLDRPTAPFDTDPAMTEAEVMAALNAGLTLDLDGVDLLLVGEMGIGNTTAAAALSLALFGGAPAIGSGAAPASTTPAWRASGPWSRPPWAITAPRWPIRWRPCAGSAGANWRRWPAPSWRRGWRGCRCCWTAFICCAAAAVWHKAKPGGLDHALAAHVSQEPGHARLLAALGKGPLLDLGMRLGEASGAAVALGPLRAAVACHVGMATFAEAGVADGEGA